MDKKILILIGIALLLIAGAAVAGFNLGQDQSLGELNGLTFVSENGNRFCVSINNTGVLNVSEGACVED